MFYCYHAKLDAPSCYGLLVIVIDFLVLLHPQARPSFKEILDLEIWNAKSECVVYVHIIVFDIVYTYVSCIGNHMDSSEICE